MFSGIACFWLLVPLTLLLSACVPEVLLSAPVVKALSPPLKSNTIIPSLTSSPTRTLPPTSTPTTTRTSTTTPTPTPEPTPTPTPPTLPGPVQASFLYTGDTPHTYIADTCQYLHDKWASTSASPGTVVMVIMFHAIGNVTSGDSISFTDFQSLMQALLENGFSAITTTQLVDFMEHNRWIPPLSVMLLVDDRHNAIYFESFFRTYQQQYGWPVVNAWISDDDSINRRTLLGNVALENEGWVDHQAHGVIHNIPMWPGVKDTYIFSELQGSIDAFQKEYNKTPMAIIWPGGGFSERSVEIARRLGFRLGFTIQPRGPLMFNWVPLADNLTSERSSCVPEGRLGDPLLLLPRYWPSDATRKIGQVVKLHQDASLYAESNYQVEMDYYNIVCSSTYGYIP